MRTALLRTLIIAVAVAALSPRHTAAQSVRGTVRDSASSQPLSGAVVGLYDERGTALVRMITNARGEYRLPRPGAATTLRVIRIGFRPASSPLPAGDAVVDIRMTAIPAMLEAVRVTGNQHCPRRDDANQAYALWEQARAGLLATVVGRETNPPHVVRAGFQRQMEGSSDRIAEQSVILDSADTKKSFTAVLSAEGFVQYGFVKDSAGKQIYYGPDAEILLDPAFTAGYCFSIRRDKSRPTQVGLGFEAADRRPGRFDIDGTLWIDTSARALKDIEYRYLRLGTQYDRFHPGGHIWFATMPNGQVLIDHWNMRLVGAESDTSWVGALAPTIRQSLHGRESGGELISASWSDSTAWHASLGTLYVHAVDSKGLPASHFVMRLENTDYLASPDENGRLEIKDLIPGPYHAVVLDSVLAPLGISMPTSLRFVAERDSVSEHRMLVPSAAEFLRKDCKEAVVTPDGGTMLVVRAVTPDGKAVKGANWQLLRDVGVSWQLVAQNQRTGENGILNHCLQFKTGDPIEVRVWRDGEPQVVVRHVIAKPVETIKITIPYSR